MNIAVDIRSLADPKRSGVGEYVLNLLDNIFAIDRDNRYYLFYNSSKDIRSGLPKWDYPNVNWAGFRYPRKAFNLSLRFFGYPEIDKLIEKRFNVELDLFFMPNIFFCTLSDNIKRAITIHDLSFERFPEFFSLKRQVWHKLVAPGRLCREADKIIAVSASTARDLGKIYRIEKEKIEVVHNGIHLPDPGSPFSPPAKGGYALFLATLEPRKNVEGLIRAFDLLRDMISARKWERIGQGNIRLNNALPEDLRLVIAGGRGWKDKGIFRAARRSRYADKIIFADYVSAEEKFSFYRGARVFIFPSFYEGFGFPPLEAMAAGTPVVCGVNSSLGEICGQAALLADPHNSRDIAEAAFAVLADKELAGELSRKGLRQAEKFSWLSAAERTLAILKSAY